MVNYIAPDRVFDALGDPTRRALVARLSDALRTRPGGS
jgi:hypothetical protein